MIRPWSSLPGLVWSCMEDHRIAQFSSVQFIAALRWSWTYPTCYATLSSALCSQGAEKERKKERYSSKEKEKNKTLRLYSVAPYALKQTQMDGHRDGGCANHRRVSAYAACVPERQL